MKTKITLLSIIYLAISSSLFAITGTATITSNSITRSFTFHAPGLSVGVNLPVMIVMHGDGGTGAGIQGYSGFDAAADAQNFLAVYPNAIANNWNRSADNVAGDACTGSSNPSNDVLFISDLIDYLCVTYQINKNKVYASGHSAGGYMAYNLAIQLTNKIAAFAPVAGSLCGDNTFMNNALAVNPPVPIYHIHGDADGTVSYPDPNNMPDSWGEWPLPAFSNDNCATNTYTNTSTIVSGVIKHRFCGGAKEISLIQIVGGGHGWPSVVGYNAATAIFTFCNAYSLSLSPNCTLSTELQNGTLLSQATLFPNPCNGLITVTLSNSSLSENAYLELMDVQGKKIMHSALTQYEQTLDVSALDNGNYILSIYTNGNVMHKKVVVIK